MNEEMRKEFEEWCKLRWFINLERSDGKYISQQTQIKWEIWQASREAMKPIKLPDETDTSLCKSMEKEIFYDGINYGIKQCREAIKQAGYEVAE